MGSTMVAAKSGVTRKLHGISTSKKMKKSTKEIPRSRKNRSEPRVRIRKRRLRMYLFLRETASRIECRRLTNTETSKGESQRSWGKEEIKEISTSESFTTNPPNKKKKPNTPPPTNPKNKPHPPPTKKDGISGED